MKKIVIKEIKFTEYINHRKEYEKITKCIDNRKKYNKFDDNK